MSIEVAQPVAAAAMTQVKLCPYDEEEPVILFHLIEAQFAAAGIKSQKLKYANALAILPKHRPSGHSGHSRCQQQVRSIV
jgi:hypothetical protein